MEDGAAEAWKVFGGDTEAGRLLKKLYGGTTKPKVSYPKLKIKPKEATSAPFIPGGGVVGADARTHRLVAKTSSRAIKAPAFTKGACPEMHPIEWLSTHKKPLKEIEKDVNEIKRQMEACRTRTQPGEKEKLQHVFSYTAGSILPSELLPGASLLDRELSHAAALRTGKFPKDRVTQLEELYDAALNEVESRKSYMSEMIALGRPEMAAPVEREVLERMSELRRIHELMQKEKRSNNENH